MSRRRPVPLAPGYADPYASPSARGRPVAAGALRGALCGLAGALAFAATVMPISEIAAEPTHVEGVRSSTWTPVTAIATLVLGDDAFSGSFAFVPIVVGLALVGVAGALLGVLGGAFIRVCLGDEPEPWLAMGLGVFFALCWQVAIFNAIFAPAAELVYRALPPWGWWVGMAAYGATLALAESAWGRRR